MRGSIILCLALAGCAGSPAADLIAGPEKFAEQDDGYCSSLGALPGSQDYINCRLVKDQQRQQRHAGALANMQAGLAAAAAGPASPPMQPIQPSPVILPPQQTRCRSVAVGGAIQTVCQ
jgi:hypothetical protein